MNLLFIQVSHHFDLKQSSVLTDSLTWASQQFPDKKISKIHCDEAKSEDSTTSAATLYHETLDDEQKKKIAILSNSLSRMGIAALKENLAAPMAVQDSKTGQALSLQRVLNAYLCGESDCETLQNRARTLPGIRKRVPEASHLLAESLFSSIKTTSRSQPKVAVESAIAISKFLEQNLLPKDRHLLVKSIGDNASLLISVLSTASMRSVDSPKEDDPLECLFVLAAVSKTLQTKMVKRRCTVLAIARSLSSVNHWARIGALDFCNNLFADTDAVVRLSHVGSGNNRDILVNGLISLVFQDSVVQNQLTAVSILSQIQELDCQVEKIMECMKWLAFQSKSRDAILASTNSYCRCVRRQEDVDTECLRTVVEFTGFTQKEVRHAALVTIELQMCAKNTSDLLKDSDLINNCHQALLEGPGQDCSIAFDILRQLARSTSCHAQLYNHPALLETVIHFVASQEVPDPLASEILLALVLGGQSGQELRKFPDVLPWLIKFVDTTGANEDVNEQLVAVIVRLALLPQ